MLFNVDRNAKQNMLQQYKQDALEYEQRKLQEKQKRIQEEREYLAQNQKRETEIEDRIRLDKLKRQNETMAEYKKMLEQNNGYWKHSKNDLKINNYGNPYVSNSNANQISNYNEPVYNNNNELINDNNNNNRILSPGQRERAYIRREDHMGNYLTDKQNANEVENYFLKRKENRQKYYKELLDSQVCYILCPKGGA